MTLSNATGPFKGAALAALLFLTTAAAAAAQSWVPFGDASWIPGGCSGATFQLETNSALCVVEPAECPYGITYGGAELVGGPTDPEAITSISFWFDADRAGAGGGSPRLVFQFSDGGKAELRPLNWTGVCQFVDGLSTSDPNVGWDNNGGSCGYVYQTDWTTVKSCHAGATITAIYVVNDSGWLYDPETVLISKLEVNGAAAGPTKDACKNGGWRALGFRNQGQCVAYFQSNRP